MEAYVTLDEAARLEEVQYKTFAKRLDRGGSYLIKTEKSETGGKERVLVAVGSLSRKAQEAYRRLGEMQELTRMPETETAAPVKEEPWYVTVDLDWYIENFPEQYYRAVELGNIIRKFLDYDENNRSAYAEEFARQYLGKGQRTLYRYMKYYVEANAWAIRKAKEDGRNHDYFKVLCLCRKPKQTDAFPSFTPEVKQLIKNIWFNRDFAANRGTREMLYEKLQEMAKLNGWEKIPSYQSVTRYINYLMEDEDMYNAWCLASYGIRDYKNRRMLKGVRDTTSLQVMEIVQGDEHTFDCWVAYKNPNGKVSAVKPKLVAWIDTRSRAILGDVICKDANSKILKRSLLKMLYSEVGGVPKYLYIDNGKDYTAETMTGRKRNDRGGERHSVLPNGTDDVFDAEFDDKARGFYKSIGIVDDHRAMPYEPWSKGQIERFFGGVCSRFTKWMTSYTGTLTGSKTIAKIDKDIRKMLENGQLLTMEEFFALWSQWLEEKYMNHIHSALKKAGEEYKTPKALFMNGDRYFKPVPPKAQATMLMLENRQVRVYNTGIRMFNNYYRSVELANYIDRYVNVKYDPEDITGIYVFNDKQELICEAQCQELLQIAPQVHQEALKKHIKMQKQQLKHDRMILEEANRPFTELNDELIGFDPVTGGIPLMMGKNQKTPKAKVVSMPDDRTYRNNEIFRKPEEPRQESKVLNMAAERALRKIKAIGEE